MTLAKDKAMKTYLQTPAILIALTSTTTAVAAGRAPACAPVLKAMAKTLVADHTTVMQSVHTRDPFCHPLRVIGLP
jgi:hypothetical protein